MMRPVMMAPIVVVAPMMIAADTTRTVSGRDDAARRIGIIIGVIVVGVIVSVVKAAGEEAPVGEPMAMMETAIAKAAAMECRTGADPPPC